MKYLLVLLINLSGCAAFAQKETFDIITFVAPKGWNKTTQANSLGFSVTNERTRTWAQIGIYKSTDSKGSADADFQSEWEQLGIKPYGVGAKPMAMESHLVSGWNQVSGAGQFMFNGDTVAFILSTVSDGIRCTSITMMSNTQDYGNVLTEFISSVNLPTREPAARNPVSQNTPAQNNGTPAAPVKTAPPVSSGFQFGSTNFDDGWVSVIREDWVEVTRRNVIVRLHYPNPEANITGDPEPVIAHAWNKLVAPRYSSLQNYKAFSDLQDWQRPYLGTGMLTNREGKRVYVAIFRKGSNDWVEVETPDKQVFVNEFGFDPDALSSYVDSEVWAKLLLLPGYNKFAIGENDLTGKWSSDFSSSMQYYNSYTGFYAGYSAFQSHETFTFGPGKAYNWKLIMVQSVNGASAADQGASAGAYKFNNNWQIWFSKIDKGPKTYDAYFSAVKGGRILNLKSIDYGGYNAYGKVGE